MTDADEFLKQRQRAYQLAFTSPAGQEVLRDLMKFCRTFESCFHPDPRLHAVLEGRREIWLRIEQHLNLPHAELYKLYTGSTLKPRTEDVEELDTLADLFGP